MAYDDLNNIFNPTSGTSPPAAWGDQIRDNFEHFNRVTPLGAAWTSYTTTWSGTLGNGTKVAYYQRVGRTIHYRIKLTWGSTSSHAAATQTFTLPVAPHADYSINAHIGNATYHDSGTAVFQGACFITSGSTFLISYKSDVAAVAATNTLPMTWTTSDQAFISGTYEAASD